MGLSANKPLRTVIISGTSITVLQDSGATISMVDEATFQRYKLEKKVKIKTSRCHIKPYGVAKETNLIPVIGSFEALTESESRMKMVTWQWVKGETKTALLLSYQVGKDLGTYTGEKCNIKWKQTSGGSEPHM